MTTVNTFDPRKVVLAINDYPLKDFASGTFIEIIQSNPYFQVVSGIRGKNTRKRMRDRSGVLTIRIMQTSKDNEVLSQIVAKDDINQTGRLTITLRDGGGQTAIQLCDAFIEGPPNMSFSSEQTQPREWKIHYQYISQYFVGGNQTPLLDLLSNIKGLF